MRLEQCRLSCLLKVLTMMFGVYTYNYDWKLFVLVLYKCMTLCIKTHDSESRGQEEAGRTRRTSELFTRSTALKFVNALNKPP